jgi:acyl carrier protein
MLYYFSLGETQNPNMEDKIQNIVSGAIDRLNELLPTGQSLPKETTTILLGRGGWLDSMGFVNLLVALEEQLEKQLGITATIADEVMLDGQGFSTIGELHELLARVVRS